MDNHFVYSDPNHYIEQRDLNVIKHYAQDQALYLHKKTGKSLTECYEFVKKEIKKEFKPPTATFLHRKANGDREVTQSSILDYILYIQKNKLVMAPTMTVYKNMDDQPSLYIDFVLFNKKKRGKSKKEMFKAKNESDLELFDIKKNEQNSFKRTNNSLSGAQASSGNILYNRSAHSSLTSTCRTATSYGNANNEKFLYGNRHYWSDEIVKANIISIIRMADYTALEKAMTQFNLHYPTVEEVCQLIQYSTDLYWTNKEKSESISQLVATLNPLERAAFSYIGDFYHLAQFNESFVKSIIHELATKTNEGIDHPDNYIDLLNSDLKAYIGLLCQHELEGHPLHEKDKISESNYRVIGANAKQLIEWLDRYEVLIKGLWRPNTLPSSIAHIRSSIRRGVITSDTDSTIFTVQYWVKWVSGMLDFSEKSNAIGYAVTFLATQTIAHILAIVSAGMGVNKKFLFDLKMKSEFTFPIFTLTSMSKHYFAYRSSQEGNVYKELELEIKGVYLKDSNIPKQVMNQFNTTLKWVMDSIIENGEVEITHLANTVIQLEKDIIESIYKGEIHYLRGVDIKNEESYVNPESSPFAFFDMWTHVFSEKYGACPHPPYSAVKVPLDLKGKKRLETWLDTLEDRSIGDKLIEWLDINKRKSLTTLYLPREIVETKGIPIELIKGMDSRKLIFQTVKPFYILLDSLGYGVINQNITRLLSDLIEEES